MRIVSLLPSATEMICRLGLREHLVGVTHECDHPASVQQLPKVTRTLIPTDASSRDIDLLVRERLKSQRALYTLDLPVLERLAPDLILTQALCDVCAVAEEEVQSAACSLPGHPRVVNLEPNCLHDVLACMEVVGRLTACQERAQEEIERLRQRIAAVAERSSRMIDRPRVMLLEWIDPPFSGGHWNPELVRLAGGMEVIGREGERSRTTAWSEIIAASPEVLFISCCGFGIARTIEDVPLLVTRPGFIDLPCVRDERVYVADGSAYFSRPGPRLVDSLEILAHAIDPVRHPPPQEAPPAVRLGREHWG